MRSMKILLKRLVHKIDDKKIAERYTINTTYKSESQSRMLFYPIPDFIEDKHCMCPSCKNEGICVSDKFFVYCGACASNQFDNPVLTQEKVLTVPSVTQGVLGNAFEWQIQGNNDAWYKIKGGNIKWDSTQRLSTIEIKKRWDDLMIKVLEDNVELCEATYDKDIKQLIILV